MSTILSLLIGAALGGFFYRCRGGFLGTGHTQLGRIMYWALPVGFWACLLSPVLAPIVALMAFLGLLIPHSAYMSDSNLGSVIGMAVIGLMRMALIFMPFAYDDPSKLLFTFWGLLSGAAYYIGWTHLDGKDSGIQAKGFSFLGITFAAGRFAKEGSAWGEVLTGAAFGIAFALAAL